MKKPFEFEINGEMLRFKSEEDAARFFVAKQRLDSGQSGPPKMKLRLKRKDSEPNVILIGDDGKEALAFLDVIRSSGEKGADSEKAGSAIGVGVKGLGSRLRKTRAVLESLGLDAENVYYRQKVPGLGSFWKRRSGFDAAYAALKRAVNN